MKYGINLYCASMTYKRLDITYSTEYEGTGKVTYYNGNWHEYDFTLERLFNLDTDDLQVANKFLKDKDEYRKQNSVIMVEIRKGEKSGKFQFMRDSDSDTRYKRSRKRKWFVVEEFDMDIEQIETALKSHV